MANVDVPAQLLSDFMNTLPADVDAGTEQDWGGQFVTNGTKFLQYSGARAWSDFGALVPQVGPAEELLHGEWSPTDAIRTFQNAQNLGEAIGAVSEGMLDLMEAAAAISGVVESIPIIAVVAKVGVAVQNIFWKQWGASRAAKEIHPNAPGWFYNKESDQTHQNQMLAAVAAVDWNGIFMPRTTVEELGILRVPAKTGKKKDEWHQVIVHGDTQGLGVTPGTDLLTHGWESLSPWSSYRPGVTQSAVLLWAQLMGPTRVRYQVNYEVLSKAWLEYWGKLEQIAYGIIPVPVQAGVNLHKDDPARAQAVVMSGLRPIHSPGGMTNVPQIPIQEVPQKYWTEAYGNTPFQPTMKGFTQWKLETVLYAWQQQGLGTTLCAYVSESDPAFQSQSIVDSPLFTLLKERRKQLLGRKDVLKTIELSQVPDLDFRQEIETRLVGDITLPPQGPQPALVNLGDLPGTTTPTPGGTIAAFPNVYTETPEPSWLERYGPYILGATAVAGAGYFGYRAYKRRKPNGLYLPPGEG